MSEEFEILEGGIPATAQHVDHRDDPGDIIPSKDSKTRPAFGPDSVFRLTP